MEDFKNIQKERNELINQQQEQLNKFNDLVEK